MKNMKVVDFAAQTASAEPVPGGGSIAAVSGALGAALAEMVANLTIGKKKYVEVECDMKAVSKKAAELRDRLLDDIQRDSDSFNDVMIAMKLPKNTDEEKKLRTEKMQAGLKIAATVPYEIACDAFEIMPLAEEVVNEGNKSAVTDGLVSAMMSRTAVLSALLNTKINLASIKDEDFVSRLNKKVKELENKVKEYEEKILNKSPY
ncbi:cyclodeaminase/cyclohydrolase family protein [Sedimentibacter sp. zth1]|uniref:cyclodeaminase/cyclohydrolase family protein n=1 Tax=Sedimentibacter sp. zth1 TaxID=2816908 RepID=UPI001A90F06C|nr:cyclodeaminase/cyclohydrolase family protein [Sedimentibacter sp. zth1]QSX07029.1 cyclodeaminase/cyclohydrolase family protein [Sedimentibacter sp. zth1]